MQCKLWSSSLLREEQCYRCDNLFIVGGMKLNICMIYIDKTTVLLKWEELDLYKKMYILISTMTKQNIDFRQDL
jgi:hypothetical protein